MAFEIFSSDVSRRDSPSVTVSPLGRLSFNKAATKHFEEKNILYALLLWDGANGVVGLRRTEATDTRAFKIVYGSKGNGAGISALPFLKHIRYDFSKSRSFAVHWKHDIGLFTFVVDRPDENGKSGENEEDPKG